MNSSTFTEKVARAVLGKHASLLHVTVIVPSERMISYLHKAFFTADQQPKIAPKIITIDRWLQQCSRNTVVEKTRLLFRLYEIFKKDPVDHHDISFDKFLTWGQLLLSDFEETDRYLANAKELFKNLRDVHEIEAWSFNSTELSPGQKKFMAFWEKLGLYYYALEKELADQNETTRGKIYKEIANNIDLAFRDDKDAHFVFAGFNAMSAAELAVVKQLYVMGRADVYIDSDHYYLDDRNHEAGTFHRVLLETLGVKSIPFQENGLASKSLSIELIDSPFITSQASAIGTILSEMTEQELKETVVLLADEELITSLIQHLPANIGKANITLGLPLKNTSLRLWLDFLFSVQENYNRGNKAIYFKEIRRFHQHPFVHSTLRRDELRLVEEFDKRISRSNRIFINASSLPEIEGLETLKELIFTPWQNDWKRAVQTIQEINRVIDARLPQSNVIERAIIRTFYASLVDFANLLEQQELPEMSLNTFKTLFSQGWKSENIAYFGNPINGLQIMGLLETRGIDFKNLLVLGLNEGKMPPTNPIQTLIPMDLRRFYALPTPREKQGLFAHHFYRLLHSAEKVFITHSSTTENISSSEPSRYVRQLELELSRVNPNVSISHRTISVAEHTKVDTERIEKSAGVLERLDQLFTEGISASALRTYVECPMNFYYKYMLRLAEEEEVEENIQSSTYGSILHKVMENLLREFKEHDIPMFPEHFEAAIKKLPLEINRAFQSEFSQDELSYATGITQVNFRMAEVLLRKMLLREKAILEEKGTALRILGLEQKVETETQIEVNGNAKKIRITGVIDRMDKLDGKIRILDYKSGACTEKDVKSSKDGFIEQVMGQKGKYLIQLLNYTYLYHQLTGEYAEEAGILSFRNITNSPYLLNISGASPADYPELFLELLTGIAEDMYSDKPFAHNPDAKYCSYCNSVES